MAKDAKKSVGRSLTVLRPASVFQSPVVFAQGGAFITWAIPVPMLHGSHP
jgi:hypothetical protein